MPKMTTPTHSSVAIWRRASATITSVRFTMGNCSTALLADGGVHDVMRDVGEHQERDDAGEVEEEYIVADRRRGVLGPVMKNNEPSVTRWVIGSSTCQT